ncbi:MAG: VOC family protein [Pseudomonadota bacterium]|nr:VOC family protein [Pseudomonadota bacterium]
MNLNQITLPALDIAASVAFYRGMGFLQIVNSPHYARFECPEGDATFSVHAVDSVPADSGVVVYFECEALDEQVRDLEAAGYRFSKLPTDERWLWREARLTDPSGNVLCLYQPGDNRRNPPWRMPAP